MNQGATTCLPDYFSAKFAAFGPPKQHLVHAPMLTTIHWQRKLEFARQYRKWMSTEWRQKAFSNESRFMLHRTDGRWHIWVYRNSTSGGQGLKEGDIIGSGENKQFHVVWLSDD
ncbi:transposable element Tcb1 transposase [Trichonephila clavipes]|nr:transposable element Tcb1 transposase [Trichonephila clavipes]